MQSWLDRWYSNTPKSQTALPYTSNCQCRQHVILGQVRSGTAYFPQNVTRHGLIRFSSPPPCILSRTILPRIHPLPPQLHQLRHSIFSYDLSQKPMESLTSLTGRRRCLVETFFDDLPLPATFTTTKHDTPLHSNGCLCRLSCLKIPPQFKVLRLPPIFCCVLHSVLVLND